MYTAIAWVMKSWHSVLSTFLDPAGGITWALSIVLLVVTIRVLLFRLFVKQVKSQRAMQEIQPELAKIKKQYGSDKQGYSQAVMALQKERGVNPLAGCLPILPQIPVFIGLFHVLRRIAPGKDGLYTWSDQLTDQAAKADLFGAPISSSFNMMDPKKTDLLALPGVSYTNIRVVAMILIVIMCFTTYYTQKQIQRRSGPVEGQAATIQKLLLYGMPASLFVSGFLFPIGVLLYWFTNNLWTLGQQFYILKKLPPPGSPAALAKAAAEKPAIDPKALAPRPGAKPVRPKRGAAGGGAAGSVAPSSTIDAASVGAGDVPSTGGPDIADVTPPTADVAPARPTNGRPRGGGGSSAAGSPGGGKAGQGPANRARRKRR
ncbi:membrane protein insertase YidC [Modestobacter sp. I12A-02628]|uniref:Membrane protein insertase YidC n=1 Tax=Goekera deserti TaxID=2497753 RepID=A0A7K3WFV2_9ACTN|nr:membrane protein insertase YidC [Goekera deserti]NDI49915.1 membrane protein insertase YidC [Goekera deserti]NEL55277.1 membrane protein insertase YidC [Goekera deserti]